MEEEVGEGERERGRERQRERETETETDKQTHRERVRKKKKEQNPKSKHFEHSFSVVKLSTGISAYFEPADVAELVRQSDSISVSVIRQGRQHRFPTNPS